MLPSNIDTAFTIFLSFLVAHLEVTILVCSGHKTQLVLKEKSFQCENKDVCQIKTIIVT
jgi:hypothetical protein